MVYGFDRSETDINTRMPREEASAIFREIKTIGRPSDWAFAGTMADVTCPSSFSRPQAICGDNGQLSQVSHTQSRVVKVVRCMRRGKSTCGDIDVMITRSPDDGRTHAGMLISGSRAVWKICSYSTFRNSFEAIICTTFDGNSHRGPLAVVRRQ